MRNGSVIEQLTKKLRRLDGNYTNRRLIILLFLLSSFILYFGPTITRWLFSTTSKSIEAFEDTCLNERLKTFENDIINYDAVIVKESPNVDNNYLPYVGNGLLGVEILLSHGKLYIKDGRTLSLNTNWDPLIKVLDNGNNFQREAFVVHFTQGIVYKYQCSSNEFYVTTQYYAHQIYDNIFIQEINIYNPSSISQQVDLKSPVNQHWTDTKEVSYKVNKAFHNFVITTGLAVKSKKIFAVAVVSTPTIKSVTIKPHENIKVEILTSIFYNNEPLTLGQYNVELENVEKNAVRLLKKVLLVKQLRNQHLNVWQSYWQTGFSISKSLAAGALNGDKINSTIYYILSQISKDLSNVEKSISNNVGCYRGHHTLNAPKLWGDMSTIDQVNSIVNAWLITLENQGCRHLLRGGPLSVQQAFVLSLGSLRFSNQDLEFNIHPQYLHRNYLFRRISYGNITHINISVSVGVDNRAIISVALDRSDSDYYACDAGCLDSPVPLSQIYTNFPVKLTEPLTALLYITSDYHHLQGLRNSLHVHAIEEAPAHDHQVMALHKHGHQLGGLPTFFWVSICFLIIIFHMFLCKIIFTEYFGHQRIRYNKK